MANYILRRLLLVIPTLLGVSLVIFFIAGLLVLLKVDVESGERDVDHAGAV